MTTQLYDPPKVGGDALAYCTRCKMELAHVIVSMLNGRPAKVLCKTCKSQHNFKRIGDVERGTGAIRAGATRAPRATRTTVRVAEVWEQKMAEKKTAPARAYSIKDSFKVGDVIQHPQFGLGLVEEVKNNGKISVLFRENEKVLVHEMGKVSAS